MYEPQKTGNGYFQDHSGQNFRTADNQPPESGTKVIVVNSSGQASTATWNGSVTIPDSK